MKATVSLVMALAASACSQHAAPSFGLGDVLLVRIVPSTEEMERGSLDVVIQITNHTRMTAHFGDEHVYPWLEALHMDDPELAQGVSKGHGQALSPFIVESRGTVVLKKTIRLDQTPPGRYLIRFDAALRPPEAFPLLVIPAIVRLQEPR